jgi:hypothetical protein
VYRQQLDGDNILNKGTWNTGYSGLYPLHTDVGELYQYGDEPHTGNANNSYIRTEVTDKNKMQRGI